MVIQVIEQYFQVVLFVFDNFAKSNSRFFIEFLTCHYIGNDTGLK